MLSIILLAAGMSRRMGTANKLLLPFGRTTVLETTLEELQCAHIGEVLVITGHEADSVEKVLKMVKTIKNPHFSQGLTGSIQTGIAQTAPAAKGFMICLADMPLIRAAEYRLLAGVFAERLSTDPLAIVQPRFQGQPGNPVLFSAHYRSALLALGTPDGAKPLVQAHATHRYFTDMPTDAVLLDADTPEAYQLLLERNKTGFYRN